MGIEQTLEQNNNMILGVLYNIILVSNAVGNPKEDQRWLI